MPPRSSPIVVRGGRGPSLGDGPESRPDPADVERWLGVARARLEDALARFDQELVEDIEVSLAASRVVAAYMAWTRRSVAGLVSVRGSQVVGPDERVRARERWDTAAAACISASTTDPNGVERFLWRWVAEVHGAVATGYASLHADATAW